MCGLERWRHVTHGQERSGVRPIPTLGAKNAPKMGHPDRGSPYTYRGNALTRALIYLAFSGWKLSIQLVASKGAPGALMFNNAGSGVLARSLFCNTF